MIWVDLSALFQEIHWRSCQSFSSCFDLIRARFRLGESALHVAVLTRYPVDGEPNRIISLTVASYRCHGEPFFWGA